MRKQSPMRDLSPARPRHGPDNSARGLRWAMGAVLLGLLLMYNSVDASSDDVTPPAFVTAPAPAGPAPTPTGPASATPGPPSPSGPALPRSPATRIVIPDIAVNAPFTELTLNDAGGLNAPAPDDRNLAGWYRDGASPGERGSAIVAGHVDTTTGPAVFWLLSALQPGSTIDITRADGIVATFFVDSVEVFHKDDFPDDRVYTDTEDAQLRLITCGGVYDREIKDYTANVVVFAHLDSFTEA